MQTHLETKLVKEIPINGSKFNYTLEVRKNLTRLQKSLYNSNSLLFFYIILLLFYLDYDSDLVNQEN